jgi:hypothetical protein
LLFFDQFIVGFLFGELLGISFAFNRISIAGFDRQKQEEGLIRTLKLFLKALRAFCCDGNETSCIHLCS